ncbi:hypothetical protein HpMS107_53830 [Helicobacter pylori]
MPPCGGRIEADAVIADQQLQPARADAYRDVRAAGLAVLHHVGQRFLQGPHDIENPRSRQMAMLKAIELPMARDVMALQQPAQAMAQRHDLPRQRRLAELLAGSRIDDDAQVVAQRPEHRQHFVWRDVMRAALQRGDAADKCAAEPVVEVVRQIEPLVEPRVGNLVLALAPQVDDEFGLGFGNLAVQLVVEPFDPTQVGHEAPCQHQRHSDHLDLRSQRRVVGVVRQDAKKGQQVVHGRDEEDGDAN